MMKIFEIIVGVLGASIIYCRYVILKGIEYTVLLSSLWVCLAGFTYLWWWSLFWLIPMLSDVYVFPPLEANNIDFYLAIVTIWWIVAVIDSIVNISKEWLAERKNKLENKHNENI